MSRASLRELCERARQACGVLPAFEFDFGVLRLRVHTNAPALLQKLHDAFAPFAGLWPAAAAVATQSVYVWEREAPELDVAFREWPRQPGKSRRKEEIAEVAGLRVVHKVRTGMQFVHGGADSFALGPCVDNANQVVNFVGAHYLSACLHRGWQLCHAAAITDDDRGVAIAGLSGGGKSTLALHLVGAGFDFLSNDRVLVRQGPCGAEMLGAPKLPRINPGTALHNRYLADVISPERAAQLRMLPALELWDLEEKYDVDIEQAFGPGRMRMQAALQGVIVLNWQRHGDASPQLRRVDLATRPELLGAVVKAAGPFYVPAGSGPADGLSVDSARYLEALRGVPAYEMVGRVDFAVATELCADLLRSLQRVSA